MDTTFIFSRPVDDLNFAGRQQDVAKLRNLIAAGENVALYGEPKTGKMSLLRKALSQYVKTNQHTIIAEASFMSARTTDDILISFASAAIRACTCSPAEIRDIVRTHLARTHLTFDQEQFMDHGSVLSSTWLLDGVDMEKVFELPGALAEERGLRIIMLVTEFQSILFPEESYELLKTLERICERHDTRAPIIFTGMRLNAMKEIFDVKKWFWRSVERIMLPQMDSVEILNHYYRGFQHTGKVIEKELIMNSAMLLRCNMWYLSQLFSITDQMCHGFVNKTMMAEAMDCLTSIHEPRFYSAICSLTDFQIRLLRAILDGETRFSSTSIIDKYQLNSSANVKRLKDALIKKEIVWFDDNDNPHVQDPLFELWLRKQYFKLSE